MSNLKIYTICVLIILNIILSFSIIWLEHITRSQFRSLQSLSNQKYELKNEWKKTRIIESRYTSHSGIEARAVKYLNMSIPKKRVLININD